MADVISVHAAELDGIDAWPIEVEASLDKRSSPGITLLGVPDTEAYESAFRVRAAIEASGFSLPREHVVVKLSPAEIRKSGTSYDLPIAVAILAVTGQIPREGIERFLFSGELSLTGTVLPARGDAARLALARSAGLGSVFADGAAPCEAEDIRGCSFLMELRDGAARLDVCRCTDRQPQTTSSNFDFADIIGHENAKRALLVAATGGHGAMLVGAPGSGKSMLVRRLTTILPPLSEEERELLVRIASVAGEATAPALAGYRPFRAPHSSISIAGMVGGGRTVVPGEVTLAHGGVLFLDDFQDFPGSVLRVLQAPALEKSSRIARLSGTTEFPSDFQLVLAALPCPCGHLGDPHHGCRDTLPEVLAYQDRVSWAAGRLGCELSIDVAGSSKENSFTEHPAVDSATLRDKLMAAREFRAWNEAGDDWQARTIVLSEDAGNCLDAFRRRISDVDIEAAARVARTVADLAEHPVVEYEDMAEALCYIPRDAHIAHRHETLLSCPCELQPNHRKMSV